MMFSLNDLRKIFAQVVTTKVKIFTFFDHMVEITFRVNIKNFTQSIKKHHSNLILKHSRKLSFRNYFNGSN